MAPRGILSLLLVVALVVPPAAAADQAPSQVRVSVQVANLRSQPSNSGPLIQFLHLGDVLQVLDVAGDWYHVQTPDGKKQGYIYKFIVERVEAPRPQAPVAVAPPAPQAAAPVASVKIDHHKVGCVVAGEYPKIDACFVPGANVGRAQVHFRAAESDPWYAVELVPDGTCFSAYLPKPQRSLQSIEYYVHVVDRGFQQAEEPDKAPAESYRPRVVGKEGDCDRLERLATGIGKVLKPVVVSVVRGPSGEVLDQAAIRVAESHMLLTGFSTQGVVVSSTGTAVGASGQTAAATGGRAGSGSSGGSGAAGAAAGGAAAAGGLSGLAIAGIAVGGLAVVGGVVAATKGGSSSSSNNGSNGSSSGINLTGTWSGPVNYNFNISQQGFTVGGTCQDQATVAWTESSGSLQGNLTIVSASCTATLLNFLQGIPGAGAVTSGTSSGGTDTLAGTASPNGALAFQDPSGYMFTGTYSQNSMSGTMTAGSGLSEPGFTISMTGTWSFTR